MTSPTTKVLGKLRSAIRYGGVTLSLLKEAAELIDQQQKQLEVIHKLSGKCQRDELDIMCGDARARA